MINENGCWHTGWNKATSFKYKLGFVIPPQLSFYCQLSHCFGEYLRGLAFLQDVLVHSANPVSSVSAFIFLASYIYTTYSANGDQTFYLEKSWSSK